jgi:hypothetical protein
MDMRQFYKKIKEFEAGITNEEVIVVSNDTPDGGKAGVMSELKRSLAARMLTEGKVRLATEEEVQSFQLEKEAEYSRAQEVLSSSKVQIAVISEAEMKAIKGAMKTK